MDDSHIDGAEKKLLLRPGEVARILRVSISTVHRMMNEGDLPYLKIRGQKRIRSAALTAYLTRCEQLPA